MKKVAIACVCFFISFADNSFAMQKDEEKVNLTTPTRSLSSVESNSDESYLKFLKTSQNRWKIAGHVFGVGENILDAFAYGGVMFSQALPDNGRKELTYAMVAIATAKLVCIKLKDIANNTAKERADEIAELKRLN